MFLGWTRRASYMMEHLEHIVVLAMEIATYFDRCLDLQQSWFSSKDLLSFSDEPPNWVYGWIDERTDLLDDWCIKVQIVLRTTTTAKESPLSSRTWRVRLLVLQWLAAHVELFFISEILVVVQVVDYQIQSELFFLFIPGIRPVIILGFDVEFLVVLQFLFVRDRCVFDAVQMMQMPYLRRQSFY